MSLVKIYLTKKRIRPNKDTLLRVPKVTTQSPIWVKISKTIKTYTVEVVLKRS